jgi:hypothetical protein
LDHQEVAMSPADRSRLRGVFLVALLPCISAIVLLTALPAAAQPPGVSHRRGQAAIQHLGSRLPAVAARHNVAAARLRELFLTDPYIAIDEADNLLFIDEFVPEEAEPAPAQTIGTGSGPLDLAKTFQLHSLPGATKVIYLDFDGHSTSGTSWNSGYGDPIVSAPYNIDGTAGFSSAELERIQYIWQRVAEDYLPYGVDVTTADPGVEALRKSGTGDVAWGQRVVISPTNWYNTGAGGVAYVGAFSWSSDTPCFVFTAQLGNGNEKYVSEAAAHEAGHTVGLYHDGVTGGSAYYSGHGGWAPIMGVGYYQTLVQWSKGEYPNANNTEDDLTKITGYGFTFRPDDHGDTAAGATALVVSNSTSVSGSGIIERPADKDAFSFMTGAGAVTLNVTSPSPSPNLDIRAELYDPLGVLVAVADPSGSLEATISYAVETAGTFRLIVEGVGKGDLATGYSDYGSLGEYIVSGIIVSAGTAQPPAAPSSLTATAVSSSQINLAWADNSNDETGFVIECSANAGAWSPVAKVGGNVTSYSDAGLLPSTPYRFRVKAANSAGDSAYAYSSTVTTPAAAGIHVGDLDGSRSISKKNWTAKVSVTVHDASHAIVSGAIVSGSWSTGGAGSCTTGSTGTCSISRSNISGGVASTTFTVTGVSKAGTTYTASANHDLESDSNGTQVVVNK